MHPPIHCDAWFTFLGVRADGAVPAMDMAWAPDDNKALIQARWFLAQHPSCAVVEVWRDGRLQAKVGPESA